MNRYDDSIVESMVDDEEVVDGVLNILTEFDEPTVEDVLETVKRILTRWENGDYND